MATQSRFQGAAFQEGLADIQTRANNSSTSQSRMKLASTSKDASVSNLTNNATQNASEAERQGYRNANEALANNPMFRQTQLNDARNFTEDTRRFDAGLASKDAADIRGNETQRFGIGAQLEGVKYGVDGNVKTAGISADAQKYGADRGVDVARLQTDASRYGADRGVDQARIGADAQVRASEIGADASRFNALLGAGTTFFNSSQYRPTFNR